MNTKINTKEIVGRSLSFSNQMLVREAYRRGITFEVLPRKQFKMSYEGKSVIVRGGVQNAYNSRLAKKLTKYKNATCNFLQGMGYSTPENAIFIKDDVERAWQWAEPILPVVLKPNDGILGKLVFVKIETYAEFKTCFAKIAQEREQVLVEQFIYGDEYRFTFVKNDVVAVANRVPANIVGDSIHTIEQLIDLKNEERESSKNPIHLLLKKDDETTRVLAKQALTYNDVPNDGEQIFIRNNSNVSTGGDAIDVTDTIHPDIKETVRKALVAIPGLRVCGVDVIIQGDSYHILEINSNAMLSMHHYPWQGEVQDVVGKVIDGMFPKSTTNKG